MLHPATRVFDDQAPVKNSAFTEIVNSVNSKRQVSVFRDAQFMRDLQEFLKSATAPTSLGTPVGTTPLFPTPLLTHPLDDSVFLRRSRQTPWWLSLNGGERHPKPMRQYRTPATWRDVSDTLRVHYLHLALATLGPVHSFSLNLDKDTEAHARAQTNSLDWLRRRIMRRLQEFLGRPVGGLFVGEEDATTGRLHLHGEIQISVEEAVLARKALRLAGGEWEEVRQYQSHTESDPDAGWAGYISKEFWRYGPIVRPWLTSVNSNYRVRMNGGQISKTAPVNAEAEKIYAEHCRLIKSSPPPKRADSDEAK